MRVPPTAPTSWCSSAPDRRDDVTKVTMVMVMVHLLSLRVVGCWCGDERERRRGIISVEQPGEGHIYGMVIV